MIQGAHVPVPVAVAIWLNPPAGEDKLTQVGCIGHVCSYDSTTITQGLLQKRQATKFLSPLKEMQKSTGQFNLSSGQALSPLVQLDSITWSSLPIRQARKFLSPLNEMQKSTGQFTLSSGQALSPLVRLVRLDYLYTESLANKTSQKISKSP